MLEISIIKIWDGQGKLNSRGQASGIRRKGKKGERGNPPFRNKNGGQARHKNGGQARHSAI